MAPLPKRIWDNHKVIGEVIRSRKMKIVVALTASRGVKFINLREWYQLRGEEQTEWRPSPNGISIPIEMPLEGEVEYVATNLIKLLSQAISESTNFPLEDNVIYAKEKTQ